MTEITKLGDSAGMRALLLTLGLVLSLVPRTGRAGDAAEMRRIQRHLIGAERRIATAAVDHLSRAQRARRRALLAALRAYRRRGIFPENRDYPLPMPYFVDPAGTRCALAELVHVSGRDDLVAAVAETQNNAYVWELADHRPLREWLDEHGLSVDEAARVQPSYCSTRSVLLCSPSLYSDIVAITEAEWLTLDERWVATFRPDRVVFGTPARLDEQGRYTLQLVYYDAPRGGGPGERAVIVETANGTWAYHLDPGDRVRLLGDPDCDGVPGLTVAQLVEALTLGDCVQRLELADPRWASARCINGNQDAICHTDAGALPRFPDAAIADDAGTDDIGPAAPSAPPLAPSADGCRCARNATAGTWSWWAVAVAVLARRRRRR